MYGSLEYATQKLQRTVVVYEGKAALVLEVKGDDDNITLVAQLSDQSVVEKPIEEYTIRSFKLGYCNTNDGCQYFMRVPMRSDWRQGLRERNVTFSDGKRTRNMQPSISRIMQALDSEYPSMADALKRVLDGEDCVAFSPAFCLRRKRSGITLFYRNFRKVGEISTEGAVSLADGFGFLGHFLKVA